MKRKNILLVLSSALLLAGYGNDDAKKSLEPGQEKYWLTGPNPELRTVD